MVSVSNGIFKRYRHFIENICEEAGIQRRFACVRRGLSSILTEESRLILRSSTSMDLFREDSFHYFGSPRFNFKAFLKDSGYRYIFYLRQCQAGGIRKLVFSIPRMRLSHAQGLEISPVVRCGGGCILGIPMESPLTVGQCLG